MLTRSERISPPDSALSTDASSLQLRRAHGAANVNVR